MQRLIFAAGAAVVFLSAKDARAIMGGSSDPAPSSVVALSGQTSSGATGLVCTGTLVAPNVVLTARHCVEEGNPGCDDSFTGAPKYVAISITTDTNTYAVASTRVPTGTKPCGDDVALLVLSSAVPASDGAPVADVRLTAALEDEGYSAVGYGWICPEGGGACSSNGNRLRKDGLAVECIECRDGTWRGTSDVTCVGDSGGPAFDAQKKVFGVTSVGGLGCTTAYYTRLDTHADWLRETVRVAASAAGATPPAWTTSVDAPPGPDGGTAGPPDGGVDAQSSAAAPASNDDGGCVVAPRSFRSDSSSTMTSFVMAGVVLLTWACRRSTRRARITTSSARATRSIVARMIRAVITRC